MVEALGAYADGRLDVSEPALFGSVPDALRTIAASRTSWEAVRGPGPMTWRETMLTLQLAAEERLGFIMRERQRMEREIEDAAWAKAGAVAKETGA